MTAHLPPDRLRAMARALCEAAGENPDDTHTRADYASGIALNDHAFPLWRRYLAAAQACWEASPGGELMEALKPFSDLCEHVDDLANETGGRRRSDKLATWVENLGCVHWGAFRRAKAALNTQGEGE